MDVLHALENLILSALTNKIVPSKHQAVKAVEAPVIVVSVYSLLFPALTGIFLFSIHGMRCQISGSIRFTPCTRTLRILSPASTIVSFNYLMMIVIFFVMLEFDFFD